MPTKRVVPDTNREIPVGTIDETLWVFLHTGNQDYLPDIPEDKLNEAVRNHFALADNNLRLGLILLAIYQVLVFLTAAALRYTSDFSQIGIMFVLGFGTALPFVIGKIALRNKRDSIAGRGRIYRWLFLYLLLAVAIDIVLAMVFKLWGILGLSLFVVVLYKVELNKLHKIFERLDSSAKIENKLQKK